MDRRILLALPLALVLGCGGAPPPSAAAPSSPSGAGENTSAGAPATAAPSAAPSAVEASTPPAEAKKPEAPAPGKAVAGDAPISSKITQDDILALVNKNAEVFNRCYTLGAGASKSYRAKVTVKATVSPVGAVNAVEIVDSTAKNPKVDACVGEAFKKLTFNRPKGSGATVFTFPMSFDGLEQVP